MPGTSATAALGGNLTLYNRPVADYLYSYALSSAYRSAWVYDPSGALHDEPDIWEIVRNQTDLLAEIIKRQSNVVRPYRVATNYHASFGTRGRQEREIMDQSKQLAAICHEGLSHDRTLDEERATLSDAFIIARRYGVPQWEEVYTSLDGTKPMHWWLPYKIKDLDRRRVHNVADWAWVKPDGSSEYVPSGPQVDYNRTVTPNKMSHPKGGFYKKVGMHLEVFNSDSYVWQRVSPDMRRNLIEYVAFDTEDRVGYGRGVLEALFFTHWFLTGTFTKITEGIDRYANGVMTGRIDGLRHASTDTTNADIMTSMQTMLDTYRSQHYMILDKNDDVEVLEPKGTGMKFAMEFVDHLVESAAKLLNGSNTHQKKGGLSKQGPSGEQGDEREAYYQQSRNALDHAIDRDLLGAFLYNNQDNIRELGLAGAKRPKFSSEQVKRQDPTESMAVITGALGAGMKLLKTEAYERIEFTPPGDDDDVIDPAETMQNQEMQMQDGLARDQMGSQDKLERDKMKQDAKEGDKDRAAQKQQAAAMKPKATIL